VSGIARSFHDLFVAGMPHDDDDSPWFDRNWFYGLTACGASAVVHCAVLVFMGPVILAALPIHEPQELVMDVQDRPDEVIINRLDDPIVPAVVPNLVSTTVSANVGIRGDASMQQAAQVKPIHQLADIPTSTQADVGIINVQRSTCTWITKALPEGQIGDPAAIADNYQEAMDRITQEVLARLARGKVLLVWVHDQSHSMKDDRDEINARIDRVYQELGLLKSTQGDALLTAVTSYGSTFENLHTPKPTSNINEIRAAMDAVPIDESGVEMMCQGIGFAIHTHRKFVSQGGRQLMVVCVTDESGDPQSNAHYLEATIAEAKAARCPIYFLGREAVFGYPFARLAWEDPQTGLRFWLQIERGPETPMPELLQIDGLHRRWDANASGFGPYEQCRMARETGGVFFMLPSPETNLVGRDNRRFALESMRPYLPDLSARADYIAERDKTELRRTLWKVITDLNPYDRAHTGVHRVEVRHGFPLNQEAFVKQAREEAEIATRMIAYLQQAEQALEKLRPLRDRESSPRWRANYDLLRAQVVSYQLRLTQYSLTLEAFAKNPAPVKNIFGPRRPTTHWEIVGRQEVIDGAKHAALRDKATKLFEQVASEHAGTPYESRARWEMARAYGVWFREDWDDPNLRRNVVVPKP